MCPGTLKDSAFILWESRNTQSHANGHKQEKEQHAQMQSGGWSSHKTYCLIAKSVRWKLEDLYCNQAIYEDIWIGTVHHGACQSIFKHLKNAFRKAKSNNNSSRSRISCPCLWGVEQDARRMWPVKQIMQASDRPIQATLGPTWADRKGAYLQPINLASWSKHCFQPCRFFTESQLGDICACTLGWKLCFHEVEREKKGMEKHVKHISATI